jgi:basic membrane protein A and related proteins
MRKRYVFALLALLLSLWMAACGDDDDESGGGGGGSAAGESSAKVAFIGVAPVTQGNWDPAGYQAFTAMAEKYGFQASNQESVGYDAAPAVLRRLARENDLVMAHSGGYESAVMEVAPEFPDKHFVVFPSTSDPAPADWPSNVSAFGLNNYQVGYLVGTAACLTAKARGGDKIGWVNSVPIPAFVQYAGTAEAAAEDLGCGFAIRWTDSFSDVSKAKQAALDMIKGGAEAIASSADTADVGSREAVVDTDKRFIALFTPSEVELAPKHTTTGVVFDFDGAYDEIGRLYSSGKLEGKKYPFNVQTGGVSYVTPFKNVDASVEKKSLEVYEKIKDGSLQVPERSIKP